MLDLQTLSAVYEKLTDRENMTLNHLIESHEHDDKEYGKLVAYHDAAQVVLDMIENELRRAGVNA